MGRENLTWVRGRDHRLQKGPDYRFKAIRLVVRKPVANVLYLFDPKTWVKLLQFSCRFKGNNSTVVPNDEKDWDINGAHQLVVFRIWRRKNVKCADLGLQPRIG